MQSPQQRIEVTSTPSEAQVTVHSQTEKFKVKTPATINLTRKHDYTLLFEKEGYKSAIVSLQNKGGGWEWGNLILGGIVGVVIDEATGSSQKFDSPVIHVDLAAEKK